MVVVAILLLAADAPSGDEGRLQGTWYIIHVDKPGSHGDREAFDFADTKFTMTFDRGKITATGEGTTLWAGTYRLDPGKTPGTIDITRRSGLFKRGIYQLDGDTLTLCLDLPASSRPTEFAPGLDSKAEVLIFRRMESRPPRAEKP
jgi:uncharacterized protein (TIGR03067 family)